MSLARPLRAQELSSSLYVRTDTDHTTVISPRVRASQRLGESTRVDAIYAADVWTSASIDIRTSASVRPVTEQRDEIDLSLGHDWQDVSLHGTYRFSSEHDYTSHGLSFGGYYDFADNAARLELNVHAISDTVGQSGNPQFKRGLSTLDASLAFTQVIDPQMLMQLTYEAAHNTGYQSSPYRVVGVGPMATGLGCVDAELCLPERVPRTRTRHALALLLRRAVSNDVSLGATYRFYLDDWGLHSHTLLGELGWNVTNTTLLSLRYRFYTQDAVRFYKPVYEMLTNADFRTRDRELSGLSYHRLGAELERDFEVGDQGGKLAASLAVSGNFYSYADFAGLDTITALEISLGLLLQI